MSPMSSPDQPEGERARIEAAAVAEVCERGFPETTVGQVCRRAGVGRQEFGKHYTRTSKTAYAVSSKRVRTHCSSGSALPSPRRRPGASRFRAVAYAIFEFVDEDRGHAQFMFAEALAAGERVQVLREQGLELLCQLIDQGRNELADPDSVSSATALALGGSIYNQIRLTIQADTLSPDLVPKLLYNVVLPYLGSEAAEQELNRAPPTRVPH